MVTSPSSVHDYENPEIARDVDRYISTPGIDPRERVALMKMAWDVIGTEFAGRHQQFEEFYGGASLVVKQNMSRSDDFDGAKAFADRALDASRDDLTSRLA
jgi:4-hydroxyphenylacetate 3-monooxygenase